MCARMASLKLLAERWVERIPPNYSRQRFLKFAAAIYNHYPGIMGINWIDPRGTVTWVFPEETNAFVKGRIFFKPNELPYAKAFEKANKNVEFTATPCTKLYQGGLGFDAIWPLLDAGRIQGYLDGVFQVELIMATGLATDILANFWVRLYEEDRLIYFNGKPDEAASKSERPAVVRHIVFPGKTWRLDIEPRAFIYNPGALPDLTVLIFGIVISSVLSLLFYSLLQRMQLYRDAGDLAVLEVNERKHVQEALEKNMNELDERVKELNCFYSISRLVEKRSLSREAILQGIVEVIPPAMQYPEIVCARILIENQEFKTKGFYHFKQTEWKYVCRIMVRETPRGILEVCYFEKKPAHDEASFLAEEINLINAIAERLGHVIERKQAEVAVLESEEKLRTLYESSINGIANFNMDGLVIDANRAFLDMIGYTIEEIKKATNQQLTPVKWHDKEIDIFKNQLRICGYSDGYEKEYIRKDGALVPVSLRSLLIRDDQDRPTSLWVFVRDISKQKLAEDTVRKSERSFRELVENSLTCISIIQDNQVVYQNPEHENLLGRLPRDPIFLDIESIHSDDVHKVKNFYHTITSGTVKILETDFRFYPPDKIDSRVDMKWVNCRASLVEYRGREAILVNMMDITTTKELEHLLRIQDKMSSLGRVTAGIAHEIRNPLSGINIYLNTLEKIYDRKEDLHKVREIFNHLQSASAKIEAVIKRVMDFSKPGTPNFLMGSINQPIEEAVSLSSVTMRKTGIKIKKDLDETLPDCHLDHQLMEQVILNLMNNAAESMKNMDGEKIIAISSSLKNDRIIINISDSGPGVPDEIKGKIFDPFYSTKNNSTGIGLSLCYRIISDHGGVLRLSNGRLGGAKFTIELPVKRLD